MTFKKKAKAEKTTAGKPGAFFGDFDADDAVDTAPADPLQVAIRLHRYARYLGQLAGDDPGDYFDMTTNEQAEALEVGQQIVNWTLEHDPADRSQLAQEIHEIRRTNEVLPAWDDLGGDERDIAEAVGGALSDWLIRQGAWS